MQTRRNRGDPWCENVLAYTLIMAEGVLTGDPMINTHINHIQNIYLEGRYVIDNY